MCDVLFFFSFLYFAREPQIFELHMESFFFLSIVISPFSRISHRYIFFRIFIEGLAPLYGPSFIFFVFFYYGKIHHPVHQTEKGTAANNILSLDRVTLRPKSNLFFICFRSGNF